MEIYVNAAQLALAVMAALLALLKQCVKASKNRLLFMTLIYILSDPI